MEHVVSRCARCEWRPTADSPDLAAHALAVEHPLCICCARSLPTADRQCCESCLNRTREHLADITLMYAELPRMIGHVKPTSYDNDRPNAADGQPLPGGDALVLLAAGSPGLSEDGTTSKPGDAGSVAYDLGWWHEDWQDRREGRSYDRRPQSSSAVVRQAVAYLDRHARWAATSHPGFDEYATDLAQLHARLERATGRHRKATRAGADCFDCGGHLIRRIDREGLEEANVTCDGCGQQYDPARYLMAAKAAAWAAARIIVDGDTWATPASLAHDLGRSERTIRSWHQRDQVQSLTRGGVLFLHVVDVEVRHEQRQST